jgi:hypothetical protein
VLANWSYQAGVFVSRSSGMIYQVGPNLPPALPAQSLACHPGCLDHRNQLPSTQPRVRRRPSVVPQMQASQRVLWAMPLMQCGFLAFFMADAVHHFWYNSWLLVPCFFTGALW